MVRKTRGKDPARNLTPQERTEFARKAAVARWTKKGGIMARDEQNVFERVRLAMETLCGLGLAGQGTLSTRLKIAAETIVWLRMDDFPTEELKQKYTEVMWHFTREEPSAERGSIGTTMDVLTEDEQQEVARKFLDLYTAVCRLEGTLF